MATINTPTASNPFGSIFDSDDIWSDIHAGNKQLVEVQYPLKLKRSPFEILLSYTGVTPDSKVIHSGVPNRYLVDGVYSLTNEELTQAYIDELNNLPSNEYAREISKTISEYYQSAMAQLKLCGEEISPWREQMLRVLRNCDNCVLQEEDDLRILFKLYEFYFQDIEVDALTEGCEPALPVSDLVEGNTDIRYGTIDQVFELTPIKTMRPTSKFKKSNKQFDLYCKNKYNHLVVVHLSGDETVESLLNDVMVDLLVKTGTTLNIKGGLYINTANGTGVPYYILRNAQLTKNK